MLAGGLFGTMLGIRSELVGLPTAVSSLISASYYIGFLIGSRLTLAGLGRVGRRQADGLVHDGVGRQA